MTSIKSSVMLNLILILVSGLLFIRVITIRPFPSPEPGGAFEIALHEAKELCVDAASDSVSCNTLKLTSLYYKAGDALLDAGPAVWFLTFEEGGIDKYRTYNIEIDSRGNVVKSEINPQ